jgi:hypothetical protein
MNIYNQKATITKNTVTNTDWIETITKSTIYTNIDCYSYNLKPWLNINNTSLNEKVWDTRILFKPTNLLIDIEMIVSITDPNIWIIWEFKVLSKPKPNYLKDKLDSLQIDCERIWK